MIKKIIIIFLVITLVGISGCTMKNRVNETFGEKKPVGAESLFIVNSTGEDHDYNGTTTYYIWGYIGNKAGEEAKNVNITAQVFDSNGKVTASKSTTKLDPKNIPPLGNSYFYIGFNDSKKIIANYTIDISTY